MNYARGKWMLHEAGSAKIQICASAFYNECIKRLAPSLLSELAYLPWMSSPNLSRIAVDEMLPAVVENNNRIDFSKRYLNSISEFISRAVKENILSVNPSVTVFEDIVKVAPKSLDIYSRSIELVNCWSPWQKNLFDSVVKSIIPVCKIRTNEETGEAFSDHHFIGALFTSIEYQFPFPDLSLNISFAHELGHQALMIYQHSGDLMFQSDAWVYSGVRKTERPIVSSLHAAVALSYMIEAIRALLRNIQDVAKSGYLHALLEEYTHGLRLGLNSLKPHPKSELCSNIIRDLEIVLN